MALTVRQLRALADGARQLATTLTNPEDRKRALQYAEELEARASLREPFPLAPEMTVEERRAHYSRRMKLLAGKRDEERDDGAPAPKWQPPRR